MAVCLQVLVSIDGCTQIPQVPCDAQAERVCVERDELLPPCTVSGQSTGNTSNGPAAQKHYYYVITMPGVGVVAAAALKSGSRNIPQSEEPEFHYWMDLLEPLQLQDAALAKELQQMEWKVLLIHLKLCHAQTLLTPHSSGQVYSMQR